MIETHTAGEEDEDGILWTNLTRSEIAAGLGEEGFEVSVTVVDQLLNVFHLGQRKSHSIEQCGE